jgi:hypothetical protein
MFSRNALLGFAAFLGTVLLGAAGTAWVYRPAEPGEPGKSEAAGPTARQKAEMHIGEADLHAADSLAKRVDAVKQLFSRGMVGAPGFADETLSWGGKWALVKEKIGLGNELAHARFLSDGFAKYVFAPADLKAALEAAVQGLLSDLDGIDNEMLVKLRLDLDDSAIGSAEKPDFLRSDEAFRQEYQRLAAEMSSTLDQDLQMTVGRELATLITIEIATPVVLRIAEMIAAELGVEAAILGTGAASSVGTFGAGLLVGLVADQAISWVLKHAGYDPKEAIVRKVRELLERVEKLLLEGTSDKPGLLGELDRFRQARQTVRHAVVAKLFQEGVKP